MNKLIQITKIALLTIILAEEVRKAKRPKIYFTGTRKSGLILTDNNLKRCGEDE